MGDANKLLAEVGGRPMVAHAVAAAREAAVDRIVVVTGHEAGQVAAALDATGIEIVHNPDYAEGLSTSLRAGFAALDKTCDGVIVMLGDMPRVSHEHLERLIAAFNPLEGRSICVPTFDGKRGNPVLFSRQYAEEMRQIAGDVGARHLIGLHEDAVAEVPMADDAIFLDVDTPDALDAVRLSG